MKALYALLTGALLIALTALGLTALASTDEEEGPPVFGFTNETCTSLNFKWFPNLGALIAYDGTEDSNDYTWDFGSYVEDVDTGYECTVLRYGEVTVTRKAPKKKQSSGGGSGGGSGSRTPQTPETTPQPEPRSPADDFTEAEFQKLRECWEEKVENLALPGWDDLAGIDTSATTWEMSKKGVGDGHGFGYTEAKRGQASGEFLGVDVYIFTNAIAGDTRFQFNHLTAFAQMHEKVHFFQYWREANDDDGRLFPSPYEKYDNEVEAHNFSARWWNAINPHPDPKKRKKGISTSPFSELDSRVTLRYKNSRGEHAGTFLRKKNAYQEIERKEAEGTLTKKDLEDKADLKEWFERRGVPDLPAKNGSYTKDLDLGCD